MNNIILGFVSLLVAGTSYASKSNSYLNCHSSFTRDGSGLMQPISLTVVNSDQIVTVKIATFKESLLSRSIVEKSEDLAHQVQYSSIDRTEFIKLIENSGNADIDSQGILELKFDRSECTVGKSDNRLVRCYKKDFSGTYFTTDAITQCLVTSDEKSNSFTRLEAHISVGPFTNTSLQMPFSYDLASCK